MLRLVQSLRIAVLALPAVLFFAPTAHADLADKVLSALEQYAGVDPDSIEMARYAIKNPGNGAIVFQHAATLDYPFFALVAAVKAVKNQNIPGIGTFTQGACVSPIAAIDQVFGSAPSYIDDLGGQATTTGVINQAKQYAVEYAQQQTATGKQQAISELNKNVPYFGDLPVICDFAFNTNFKTERNLQSVVSETVRAIRDAYNAFKDGDIGDGVDRLVGAGFNAGTVCKLADEIVSGGVISGTPILGDIVEGACKSFAGAIIKGIGTVGEAVYDEGKKIVNGAACAVESLWGGCDDDDPPPAPPNGIQNAAAFCLPYGGVQAVKSKTNAPDDYFVMCNDGSACIARPGETPKCATGAQIAAHKAAEQKKVAEDRAVIEKNLAVWSEQFVAIWGGECEDDACRAAMPPLRDQGVANTNAMLTNSPDFDETWPGAHSKTLKPVEKKAAAEIDASKQRTFELNKQITAGASQGWREIAVAIWSKQCFDDQCKNEVAAIGEEMAAADVALQDASPDKSSLAVQGEISKEYGPKFKDAIDASYNRHITADASSGWAQIAIGYWTKQCWDQQCKDEIKQIAQEMADAAVALQATSPDESSLHVQGEVGKTYGPKFKATVDASKKRKTIADPNATPDQKMAAYDCQNFLGRKGQWLCPADGNGFTACVAYVKHGQATLCFTTSGLSYGTDDAIIALLKTQKCSHVGLVGLAFSCATAEAKAVCLRFAKGGMKINCDATPLVAKLPPATKPILVLPNKLAPVETPQAVLTGMGCQQFGSNPKDWFCLDGRSFATCVGFVRASSQLEACLERDNQALYATDRRTVAFLGTQGCQSDGGAPLTFTCATPEEEAVCQQFITGGMRIICNLPTQQIRPLTIAPLRLAPTR